MEIVRTKLKCHQIPNCSVLMKWLTGQRAQLKPSQESIFLLGGSICVTNITIISTAITSRFTKHLSGTLNFSNTNLLLIFGCLHL